MPPGDQRCRGPIIICNASSRPRSPRTPTSSGAGRARGPGGRPRLRLDAILEVLDREGLALAAILNTHGHADHIAGNAGDEARSSPTPR